MYDSIFAELEKVMGEGLSINTASLYAACERVTDGRKNKGKTYPRALLLTLLLLAKLAGETTISGVVQWVRERKSWLRQPWHWPKGFPTHSTSTYALARCSGEQIAEVVAHVLLKARAVEQCGTEPSRLQAQQREEGLSQVAMDGKTLRGTLGHSRANQPSVHRLSLYDCQSGIVLTQRALKSQENEISAAGALLHPALVKGRILRTDAMHPQKRWCTMVHVYEGYSLTIVQENHPQMYRDLKDLFEDHDAEKHEWQDTKTVQKGHGRREIREIWTRTHMKAWFEKEWGGIAQVFRIRRVVKEAEKEREEIVYGITNWPRKKANASRLLALQQAHWRVENRLHYRRDVALGEDASQLRTRGAPEALAALNGAVLALMDGLQVRNVAAQMRHFCAHPQKALSLLCSALSR